MIIKELLVSKYSKGKNRLTDSNITSVRTKDPFVHTEEKTKTYFQLDSLIEHLKVYRDELRGSRVPIYERSFIRTQQERKKMLEELRTSAINGKIQRNNRFASVSSSITTLD